MTDMGLNQLLMQHETSNDSLITRDSYGQVTDESDTFDAD